MKNDTLVSTWHNGLSLVPPLPLKNTVQYTFNCKNAHNTSASEETHWTLSCSRTHVIVQLIRQEVYKLCHFQSDRDYPVMVPQLYLGVIILAVFATAVANAGISHSCQ